MRIQDFLDQFRFNPKLAGYIGVERERFLVDARENIVPRAKDFLEAIKDLKWTYELSACQVEDRTAPRKTIAGIISELNRNDEAAKKILATLDLNFSPLEVAPDSLPDEIYPDPRYLKIASRISAEQRRAAMRVAGTHVHIGTRDIIQAIAIYNRLRVHLNTLSHFGDHSDGERLRLYKAMAKNWYPPPIKNVQHFFDLACEQGFITSPRSCYWLIRISIHGTVELRMFGVFPDSNMIPRLVSYIRSFF